jgi:hypothetical protein
MSRVEGMLELLVVLRTWHIPEGEMIVIQFNPAYQPTGPGSEKFRRICGKKLPPKGKEDIWITLTV